MASAQQESNMIVAQISVTVFIISAAITFIAAQYVDFEKRFNWVDYLGSAAMAVMAISGVATVLALVWGF